MDRLDNLMQEQQTHIMESRTLLNLSGLLQVELTLGSGESCNLHRHNKTHETYSVIIGEGIIQNGEETVEICSRGFLHVEPGTPHKITNTGILPLIVLSTKNSNETDLELC